MSGTEFKTKRITGENGEPSYSVSVIPSSTKVYESFMNAINEAEMPSDFGVVKEILYNNIDIKAKRSK